MEEKKMKVVVFEDSLVDARDEYEYVRGCDATLVWMGRPDRTFEGKEEVSDRWETVKVTELKKKFYKLLGEGELFPYKGEEDPKALSEIISADVILLDGLDGQWSGVLEFLGRKGLPRERVYITSGNAVVCDEARRMGYYVGVKYGRSLEDMMKCARERSKGGR